MNILAQVGHVLIKDLRHARWTLLAYVAIVLVTTANSLIWSPPFNGSLNMSLYVPILGILLVTSAVQADSPTRTDAFWASQPLAPLAVLGAKLVLATVVVIGLPALGQAMGLAAYGVSAAHLPRLLLQSVWVYGGWLLYAMILAALTKDLRTFLLVLVCVPPIAATLIIPRVHPEGAVLNDLASGFDIHETWMIVSVVVGLGGGLALLALLYRTRDSRRYVWVPGIVCAVCAFFLSRGQFSAGSFGAENESRASSIGAPYAGPKATFSMKLRKSRALMTRGQLNLALTVVVPERSRLSLLDMVAVIHLRDDSSLRVPFDQQWGGMGGMGESTVGVLRPLLPPDVAPRSDPWWLLGGADEHMNRPYSMSMQLSDEQMAALARGVDSITLEGTVRVETASLVGTLPLEVGATMTRGLLRAEIRSWTHRNRQAMIDDSAVEGHLTAEVTSIPLNEPLMSGEGLEFALWNPVRREAFDISSGSNWLGSRWLVLPGVTVNAFDYETDFLGAKEWFSDAALAIIEWTPRGSYPLDLRIVPPQGGGARGSKG